MSNIENYNSDNILVRNVIAGVLSILNKSIKYEQIWEDNIIQEVTLPWMYDLGSSDERLMQDNYTHFGLSCYAKKIDGNFDMFPRGAIRLESTTIDSDNICNRFVRGLTTRIENGKITTYSSFLYSIPLTITFSAEIWCDNFTNMLKIEQALREYLYRNKTFYVLFRGMRIGCCLGMPNDYTEQKNTEYSLSTENGEQKIKLTFQLVVETYQPVFDRTMEMPNDLMIKNIGFDVNTNKNLKSEKTIKFTNVDSMMIGGVQTHLTWDYNSFGSDMGTVNLFYKKLKDEDGNDVEDDYKIIETNISNNSEFYWLVPDINNSYDNIIINNMDEEKTIILSMPILKIINDQCIIINPGKFITTESELQFSIIHNDNGEYNIKNVGKLIIVDSKVKDVIVENSIINNNKSLYEMRIEDGINPEIYDTKIFSIY